MFNFLKNCFWNHNRYWSHPEAVVISCYFNPQRSPYRRRAFDRFYNSIRHMNHMILECVIGDATPELPETGGIRRVYTENLLWHKESLLNLAVSKLPPECRYVFWVDADVLFTNRRWLTDAVTEFETGARVVQPFEWCVHMDKDEVEPSFDVPGQARLVGTAGWNRKVWRSFLANWVDNRGNATSRDYNTHGHVGFAWGATRRVLEAVPLYDRALIGGADHIMAHASVGQIPHPCIEKSFTDDLESVYEWSRRWDSAVGGRVGYAPGELHHLWHGDIDKRQYLKRIQEFTPSTKRIREKDGNGLYVTKSGDDQYVRRYFAEREVRPDDGFLGSMAIGYMTDSPVLGAVLGGNPAGAIVGSSLRESGRVHGHPARPEASLTERKDPSADNFS